MARYTIRTRFHKDIVAEFLPPARRTKQQKVIIICGGMPGYNSKQSVMEFYSQKGYWVFSFRYRGSWESDGRFLRISPERDVLDVINQLPRGFVDLWSGKKYQVIPQKIFLFATSFGGPAGILASRDHRVNKVVALSPVVDWRAKSPGEPMDFLYDFVVRGFGQAYRLSKKDWKKLTSGQFYNPATAKGKVDGKKIMIIHAKDDRIVTYPPVAKYAKKIGAQLLSLRGGGHLRTSLYADPRFYPHIKKFLNS